MKHKMMTPYCNARDLMRLSALLITRQQARTLAEKPRLKRPAGSVAPLY